MRIPARPLCGKPSIVLVAAAQEQGHRDADLHSHHLAPFDEVRAGLGVVLRIRPLTSQMRSFRTLVISDAACLGSFVARAAAPAAESRAGQQRGLGSGGREGRKGDVQAARAYGGSTADRPNGDLGH
jgi:hypothetical protein